MRVVSDEELERMRWGVELYRNRWRHYAHSFKLQPDAPATDR
jgi:hypothetical protein